MPTYRHISYIDKAFEDPTGPFSQIGRRLWPGLIWLTNQDRGPGGRHAEEGARARIYYLPKAKIKIGSGNGSFGRSWAHRKRNRGSNGPRTRTAIVDHGSPGALHGTSATAHATVVACANDVEVLDGRLGVLDCHKFVFGRLMGWTRWSVGGCPRYPVRGNERKRRWVGVGGAPVRRYQD
ncbi:hypothetical protein V8E53_000163 [Lactarius tabidus]